MSEAVDAEASATAPQDAPVANAPDAAAGTEDRVASDADGAAAADASAAAADGSAAAPADGAVADSAAVADGSAVASALAKEDVVLEPGDIAAFNVAMAKLKADPQLVFQPELAFFKEFLLSWGSKLEVASAGSSAAAARPATTVDAELGDDDEVACQGQSEAPAKAVAKAEAAPAVMELESDEEDFLPQEMQLPAGLLDEELADEVEKPAAADAKPEPEDLERLPKETEPFPLLPPKSLVPTSDARKKVLARVKQQAGEALSAGDVNLALNRYTEAIRMGGASALMLAARGALLLKMRRPCAAIRDCCAALLLNPDCGKAFHVRGTAHRKLGHWKKAHRDLSQGQTLDFSEDSVKVHLFVANKVGVIQDQKTGRWYQNEGAKKAVELVYEGKDKKPQRSDLRNGQAVRIDGLQRAPHLNGKRGIIQRVTPNDPTRWEVEIRLERGRVEVKSIRDNNIQIVRATEAEAWKQEEAKHAEERKRRERDEKRWQEDEDRRKRLDAKFRGTDRGLSAGGFPTMDASERLEAEMSCLPLDETAMSLLRRLRPEEALDILRQLSLGGIGNMSGFIKIKVRQRLGEPDSDDERPPPVPVESYIPQASSFQASSPAATPAASSGQAPAAASPERAKPEPEEDEEEDDGAGEDEEDSEDEDFDRLPEDTEPLLEGGRVEPEPSDELVDQLDRWKEEAHEALEAGNASSALDLYSKIISGGGATALMLTKRGELLLKQRRPCAAIKDCSAALDINPDLGKAYRIRGLAHRKLGRWQEAHRDLQQSQRLDYDEGTSAVQKFVAEKVRQSERKRPKKRRAAADDSSPPEKRAKA